MRSFVAAALTLLVGRSPSAGNAFVFHQPVSLRNGCGIVSGTSNMVLFSSSTPPPQTEADMKELIVSLSSEATDEARRKRLEDVVTKGLSQSEDASARFTELFQSALESVGNEVQAAARELAKQRYEEQQQEETEGAAAAAIRVESVNESGGKIKSPEEMQLWALVDMMVQSKTIIKRQSGDLGTKGTFQ